jgi:hypothetical protein
MSDLIKEASWLRYYYQGEEALKDKDILKDQAHMKLKQSTSALFAIPFAFQLWQISLCNQQESIAMYRRVRFFKSVAFTGAVAAATLEYLNMRKKWTYYNQFYPEATELQKTLHRDAMMFKESNYKPKTTDERAKLMQDAKTQQMYAQMYQLPMQRYAEPDDDCNPGQVMEHKPSL